MKVIGVVLAFFSLPCWALVTTTAGPFPLQSRVCRVELITKGTTVFLGSGVLISPNKILTADHNIRFAGFLGESDKLRFTCGSDQAEVPLERWQQSEKFNHSDRILIELPTAISQAELAPLHVALNREEWLQVRKTAVKFYVSGFGQLATEEPNSEPGFMRVKPVDRLRHKPFLRVIADSFQNRERGFEPELEMEFPVKGDSGGPLWAETSKGPVLLGILESAYPSSRLIWRHPSLRVQYLISDQKIRKFLLKHHVAKDWIQVLKTDLRGVSLDALAALSRKTTAYISPVTQESKLMQLKIRNELPVKTGAACSSLWHPSR